MNVSIVKCNDYSTMKNAIKQSLDLIGGLGRIIKPNDRVLLKVNLLMAKKPEQAVTTHPSVVKAIIQLVKEKDGIPFVGDSAGGAGLTDKAFEVSCIKKVAEEENAELLNFERTGTYRIKGLNIAKPLLDSDVIISLPKLKTHTFTFFTGAVKNFFGGIPGKQKSELHSKYPKLNDFSNMILDIYSAVKPKLGIMDGVLGMEGDGPSNGEVVKSNVILSSFDCVSLDYVSSALIGYNPMGIATTRLAYERKLGETESIEIVGEKIENVKIDFRKPVSEDAKENVVPFVDKEKCAQCLTCVSICPVNAINIINDDITFNRTKCIRCYCCSELCPEGAIRLVKV
ncbi:MAG: DUF362 domain-containing protein [Thermoplasmatales archaeon]|nr:DUF362 domain-containing protein [Thermoplasmatales archaeon]